MTTYESKTSGVVWIKNSSYCCYAAYYDCNISIIKKGGTNDTWTAFVRMPGCFELQLPPMQLKRAKEASIKAIETIGKAYQQFVKELAR